MHVREFGAEKPLFGFWGYEKMHRMSDRIILISQALYDEYSKSVPNNKLIAIPNGINSPLGLPFHVHSDPKHFNILLTGRLVPDKGHKDAILAMKILKDRGFEKIHLFMAGSLQANMYIDWYEDELKNLIAKNSLEDCITFCGEVTNMVGLREKMDVELMTAIKETFGWVTIEGMCSGLVLIGSNTGGTLELIKDRETGLLYQQGDEKILQIRYKKCTKIPILQRR